MTDGSTGSEADVEGAIAAVLDHVDTEAGTLVSAPGETVKRTGALGPVVLYLADAVAAGVIGNLAYDTMKLSVGSIRARLARARTAPALEPEEIMALLARAAVIEQCERHDLLRPAPANLSVADWEYRPDGASTTVTSRDASLRADVLIAARTAHRAAGVTVLIRQLAGTDDEGWITQRARSLMTSPSLREVRTALERIGEEPLDRRSVEQALRRVTSDTVSVHDLAREVAQAQRTLFTAGKRS